jgi:hypothetical protein
METKYIKSKIDNNLYCKINGQFTRHLKSNGLTYRDYYEIYVTGLTPLCGCGMKLSFYSTTESYASSCGDPICVGKVVSSVRKNQPIEIKKQQSINYRTAQARKTVEDRKKEMEKKKETYFKKYGTTLSNSDEQKNKSKTTKEQKYGNHLFNNSTVSQLKNKNKSIEEKNIINAKRRSTNLKRYGVENCFLRKTIQKVNKGNASLKEYTLPSGKIIKVRGYEPQTLNILFSLGYTESDIIVLDMSPGILTEEFTYVNNNKHKARYYPDIYIPKENKIIEVKSRWWWDGKGREKYIARLSNNLKKRQSVLAKGFLYEVWLFEEKNNYSILRDDTDF